MARKQTLKSLLGANDSRVDVDLNLDEQTFRAPTVRAGTYTVAAPVYSKTNALSQLSDSLERYSGPILKGYANIKEQQSLAMADATELLTPEQLKLLDAGDSSGLTESINNDKRQIDEAQRKKLISFAENPNNYERAYRRVGSRVAGVFVEDYLTNMDKYAEDESFDFQTKADELAEQYGLTGLGEQEFYKQINSISESTKARFGELKNAHMVRTDKAEAISDQSQQIINGTFNTDVIAEGGFYDAMAGKTLAQQEDIVQGMVTKLAEEHPKKALELIESYETGVIALGNGVIRDEFAASLENAFANEEKRVDLIAQGVETKRNDSITEFQAIYSNAIALGQDLPESTDIFINDGLTITVDTSEAKNATDVATAVADAVAAIPEDDKSISEGTKALIVRQFSDEVVKEQQRVITNRSNAGVNVASSQFMDFLAVKDSEGNTVYEGMDTELARANQTQEWLEELNPIIDAIYADPELDPAQKDAKAKMARMTFVAEKKTDHDQFILDKEDSIRELGFERDTGGDGTDSNMSIIMSGLQLEYGKDNPELFERTPEALQSAIDYEAETDALALQILNREPTAEEANLTSEAFYQKKIEEGTKLRDKRKAQLKADVADGNLPDGRIGAEQDPATPLADQEKASKEAPVAVVEFQQVNGKVESNARKKNKTSLQKSAMTREATLNKLNSTKSYIGAAPNIFGFTNHEKRGYLIKKWQDGELDSKQNVNTGKLEPISEKQKDNIDKRYQGLSAEYLYGETLKRASEDGTAPITLEELGSGSIDGVKFSPTEINQSAHVILPYELVDKAFTDPDNLTTAEEVMLREYASSLYDTSNMDEAGTEEIIQRMVGFQVNAYTLIGFGFSKKDK